jgi:hypothetical protein
MRRYPLLILSALLLVSTVDAQHNIGHAVIGGGATDATGGAYRLRGTIGQPVVGTASRTGFAGGQGFWHVVAATSKGDTSETLMLTVSLFLEGPYHGGDMRVALSGVLPDTDPYLSNETVSADFFETNRVGLQAVDWVLVQLRTGDPAAPPMQIAAQRAALLLSDGSVVEADGDPSVTFEGLMPGTYHVAVFHRNHLAALSDDAVNFAGGEGAHNFQEGAAHGDNPLKDLGGGSFGLVAGDADGDGTVADDDRVGNWLLLAGASGYVTADFNLDGNVFNDDLINYWLANLGRVSAVPLP